jgi:hypothetical protein
MFGDTTVPEHSYSKPLSWAVMRAMKGKVVIDAGSPPTTEATGPVAAPALATSDIEATPIMIAVASTIPRRIMGGTLRRRRQPCGPSLQVRRIAR